MTAREFFDAVVKMRQLQKEYFRTRSSLTLAASKKQEKHIDDEIARTNTILSKKNKQGELGL